VLQVVAKRLRNAVRESDTVARLGGDEFFVVANNVSDEAAILALIATLAAKLAEPVDIPGGKQIPQIDASFGFCSFPYPEEKADNIIRHADMAMYSVKRGKSDRAQRIAPTHEEQADLNFVLVTESD